jgi:hypothetical protein
MTDVSPQAIAAAEAALDEYGDTLGDNRLGARIALEAAAPSLLTPVYDWLVTEMAFPWDWRTDTCPPWLDVRRLAERWREHYEQRAETAEDYVHAIYEETGWPRSEGGL